MWLRLVAWNSVNHDQLLRLVTAESAGSEVRQVRYHNAVPHNEPCICVTACGSVGEGVWCVYLMLPHVSTK